jgi:hypothetical protein
MIPLNQYLDLPNITNTNEVIENGIEPSGMKPKLLEKMEELPCISANSKSRSRG